MKQIIVADDDPAIRDIFQIILEKAGYAVTTFSSGEPLIDNEFTPPDLFILDKQLSGADGLEVCRHLKDNLLTQCVPVIVMSASPHVAKLVDAAGADEFLEKPFKTKSLLNMVNKYLNTFFTKAV